MSLLLNLILLGLVTGNNVPIEITAGAFWKQLPTTLCYEATIPITYQARWMETEVENNITIDIKNSCRDHPFRNFCELRRHLTLLQQEASNELNIDVNSWKTEARILEEKWPKYGKRSLDFIGSGLNWCCGVATQQKFESMVMEEHTVKTEVSKLKNGLNKALKDLGESSKDFEIYQERVQEAFEATTKRLNKVQDMWTTKQNRVTEDYELALQDISAFLINNLKKIITIGRHLKNSQTIQSCRRQEIPSSVVPPATLRTDIQRLQTEIHPSDQEVAIPAEEIYRYYQLPISDCTISGNTITITVKIPIRQLGKKWEIFELVTTPFAWHNQTCHIQHESLFLAVSTCNAEKTLRTISGINLHQCRPYDNKLCYLPRFSSDSLHGPQCAKVLFTGATVQEISETCPMRCLPSTAMVITEVKEEVYVITHPQPNTSIVCKEEESLPSQLYQQPGALQLTLPCNCALKVGGDTVISKRYPCREERSSSSIRHVLPATWTNLKSFVLNPTHVAKPPTYENLEECLQTNWSLTIPHVNLTSTKEDYEEIREQLNASVDTYGDIYSHHSDTILIMWNLVLSVCVLILLRRNPAQLIAATLPPVHAAAPNRHVHLVVISTISLLLLIIILTALWIRHYLTRRKQNHGTQVKTTNDHKDQIFRADGAMYKLVNMEANNLPEKIELSLMTEREL